MSFHFSNAQCLHLKRTLGSGFFVQLWLLSVRPSWLLYEEGEYAMGEGFAEPLGLCWFVLTLRPSLWRPKPVLALKASTRWVKGSESRKAFAGSC